MIIAIDGPAASGKGTLARRIAAHFALPYLDTGLLYRGVGHVMRLAGADLADEDAAARAAQSLDLDAIDPEALRGATASSAASVVAVHPKVRAALLERQRAFAAAPRGAVLDGRDIGTVVCPGADVKLFVVASPEVRAERRLKELVTSGRASEADYARVLADIRARDARDSGRATAPLLPAPDAVVIDTSAMSAEEAFAAALAVIEKRKVA